MATSSKDLLQVVRVAGGVGDIGLTITQRQAFQTLMGHTLAAIADHCQSPLMARNAAKALEERPLAIFKFDATKRHRSPDIAAPMTVGLLPSRAEIADFENSLTQLQDGEHRYINVSFWTDDGTHALALACTKLGDDQIRLSIVNSNGWNDDQDWLVLARTSGLREAAQALKNLAEGQMPPVFTGAEPDLSWFQADGGLPLLSWLDHAGGPGASRLSIQFHHGHPLIGRSQKGNDCGIEAPLAWLSSVVEPSDYKLAKASVLHVLADLADRLEPGAASDEKLDLQRSRRRINDRITTSLGASILVPGIPDATATVTLPRAESANAIDQAVSTPAAR